MAKKNIEATATATDNLEPNASEKKARVSIKDKAHKHIDRIIKKGVDPMVFEEVLTAYAVLGIIKYDEVLEMSNTYSAIFNSEKIDN